MFAVYRSKTYTYLESTSEVATNNPALTDDVFVTIDDTHYKMVEERELTDIFDSRILVYYNVNRPGIPSMWEPADVKDGKVLLRIIGVDMPRWQKEAENTYTRWVPFAEIAYAKVKYRFVKVKGKKLNEPVLSEVYIELNQLEAVYNEYKALKI